MRISSWSGKQKSLGKPLYFLVMLFLIEGLIAKISLPKYSIPLKTHLLLTSIFVATFMFLDFARLTRDNTIRFTGYYRMIQNTILGLVILGLISSAIRVYWVANLMFFLIWASNFYVIWWAIPRLMHQYSLTDRMKLIRNIFLLIVVVTGITYFADIGIVRTRLGSVFGNPTIAARLLTLTFLFFISTYLHEYHYNKIVTFLLGFSLLFLIMTKTRASIFAMFVGASIILLLSLSSEKIFTKRRVGIIAAVICIIGLYFYINSLGSRNSFQRAQRYLRMNQDIEEIYLTARAKNWEAGFRNIDKYGLFGMGFLSKFGINDYIGSGHANKTMVPRYNWTSTNDPLNMIISVAKQQGWISAVLYILLFFLIWKNISKIDSEIGKSIVVGILVAGLIFGFLDGNWMTSFGDPVDRISMLTISLILSTTSATQNQEKVVLIFSN